MFWMLWAGHLVYKAHQRPGFHVAYTCPPANHVCMMHQEQEFCLLTVKVWRWSRQYHLLQTTCITPFSLHCHSVISPAQMKGDSVQCCSHVSSIRDSYTSRLHQAEVREGEEGWGAACKGGAYPELHRSFNSVSLIKAFLSLFMNCTAITGNLSAGL